MNMTEHDMMIVSQLGENQKIAFMQVFAKLAARDGKIGDDEREFIKSMALTYGVPAKRVEEIWKPIDDTELFNELKNIKNRKAALMLIKEMCILANADENLSDDEVLFIGQVGEAMGVEVSKIQEISEWVLERLIWLEKGRLIFEEV